MEERDPSEEVRCIVGLPPCAPAPRGAGCCLIFGVGDAGMV